MPKKPTTIDEHQLRRREQRILEVFLRYPSYRLRGYDVQRMARCWGAIVPELWRMEGMGLIASDWEGPSGEYPRRRVYWLEAGKNA